MSEEKIFYVLNEDNSVTFKYRNKNAKKVLITGSFRFGRKIIRPGNPVQPLREFPPSMKKEENDLWTYTTEPVTPGIYRYSFIVDGAHTPVRTIKIEGKEPMPWDLIPNIPHGTVVRERFYSKVLDRVRHCFIYLPPGYRETRENYPILYLLHGGGGDYTRWIFDGYADNIMDFLISKGKTKEMIVAMPDGRVFSPEERKRFMRLRRSGSPKVIESIRKTMFERHAEYFVKEIMPFVESRYRVLKNLRFIAGLSMGAGQTFNLITSYPDMFVAAGLFSSAIVKIDFPDLDKIKSRLTDELNKLKLLYISCGNWDALIESSRILHKMMTDLNIKHIYTEEEGGHTWTYWPKALIDFLIHLNKALKNNSMTA